MASSADAGPPAAGGTVADPLGPSDGVSRRRLGWVGLGVAAASFLCGLLAASILGATYAGIRGLDREEAKVDLGFAIVSSVGLWVGFLLLPLLWARATDRTRDRVRERAGVSALGDDGGETDGTPVGRGGVLGLAVRWVDLPLGLAVGLASTVVTAVVSSAFLSSGERDALEAKAEEVIDRAQGPAAVALLVVTLCLVTPFAEEVFFRGLLFRSVHRVAGARRGRSGRRAGLFAVLVAGVVFGPVHYDGAATSGQVVLVQLGLLALFGVALCALALRTGRLGASIVAHAVFNAVTVISLLAQR